VRSRVVVLLLLPLCLLPLAPASATPARHNPLTGHRWGTYLGPQDMAWAPYEKATGHQRKLLGRIVLQPKAKWFGAWIPDDEIRSRVQDYIANATDGDRSVVAQLTLFRMVPWEQETCTRTPTDLETRSYKRFVSRFAKGIGTSRTAVVLQPDGPFAQCGRIYSRLIRWSAKKLGALPRTSTYVEVGSSAWNHDDPDEAARLLVRDGVRYARGFHLNTTHYQPTETEVRFGARVVKALAARGVRGAHFTVDTAENGRPFTWEWFHQHHPNAFWNNAPTCRRQGQDHCVTLGIPPTTDVAAKRWHLPSDVRRLARTYVDGYLWAGRPWLHDQTAPFDMKRALSMARTTPFQ
jgi:hypothetical protein